MCWWIVKVKRENHKAKPEEWWILWFVVVLELLPAVFGWSWSFKPGQVSQ